MVTSVRPGAEGASGDHATSVLGAYGLVDATLVPITVGHINETYAVHSRARRAILQRLNPIFKPEVHHDIEAITEHLERAGLTTPRLIRTRAGDLWTTDAAGGVWRMQTFIEGEVFAHPHSAGMCEAAGSLLGRFHRALVGVEHTFQAPRFGVHDTARHLAGLREALEAHRTHAAYDQVAPLAEDLLRRADSLPSMEGLPARIVHGDPKLSNFIFAQDGSARALIDLDTLAPMAVPLELGDAFRSWCNPNGEGEGESVFMLDWFVAGLQGYARAMGQVLTRPEVALLPVSVEVIAVELAARFARDALEERYFGWDRTRFHAAWEHNLVRTRSQAGLARSVAAQRQSAEDAVARLFPQA
jgi:Ser/Thr protein kinase RdoA (MazF antagonist)